MVATGERQGGSRVSLWVIGVLVVAFALLAVYQYFNRSYFHSDPDRLTRLEKDASISSLTDTPKTDQAGEWPQWRGPGRTGVSGETGWLTDWPARGPRQLWKKEAGVGYSSLAVAGGRVYTMLRQDDDEGVICWDAATGKEKWRRTYPGRYSRYRFDDKYGAGPRSTPTVDGDLVYAVGATGIFHCLRADSGKVEWRHDLLEEFHADNLQWGVSFSPLVDGDLVFTSPGGTDGAGLAAFDKKTGDLKWKKLDDPAAYSSPVVSTAHGTRQIVFFTRTGLVSVVPETGELLWRFPWETQYGANIATPIAVSNYVFISSGYGRGCAVVEVDDDRSKKGDKLQAYRVYEHNRMRNHFSSSVLFKGYVFGFDESKLTCMDFRTGQIVWQEGGYKKGSLLIANGYLIVLGENGKLAVGPASPDGFKAKSSFQVSREKCWTVPVLAGGKLFIRDENHVICLNVREGT
jgi:outer membrane protein assembly factor BamB